MILELVFEFCSPHTPPSAHRRMLAANTGFMRYAPMRTRYARNPPARASTSRANRPSSKLRSPVVTSCATGSVIHSATPRRKQNCFYAFVHCVHTQQATTADAEPVASHKNEFCLLRPPGARPALLALRLISPRCARPPILGASALVGPATARAARHVAGPSWSPHRGDDLHHPRRCAAGSFCFAKSPVTRRARDPATVRQPANGRGLSCQLLTRPKRMRTLLVFAAGRKWGGKNKKCFGKRGRLEWG